MDIGPSVRNKVTSPPCGVLLLVNYGPYLEVRESVNNPVNSAIGFVRSWLHDYIIIRYSSVRGHD